jgi:glycosyltransferase involved in cell wall biosynthesis
MRVAFVLPNLSGGGAERVFVDTAGFFAGQGHIATLVLFRGSGVYRGELNPRVRVLDLDSGATPESMRPLHREIREQRIQVVYSTLKHVSIAIEAMRAVTGFRFLHVIRAANTYGSELRQLPWIQRTAFRTALRLAHRSADRTVCVSRGVASDLANRFGVRPERITVIHNPVYDERMEALGKEPTGFSALDRRSGFNLVAAGRLIYQKGFDVLVRAFAAALAGRDAHLYILGEGPGRDELLDLAASLRVEHQLTLTGFVPNPFAFLSRASLFVLSSRYEGLPNVLIQALCLGARILATDCESGPAEILGAEGAGCLVPVDDVGAMARGIAREYSSRVNGLDPDPFRRRYAKRDRCADYERLALELLGSEARARLA